MLQRAAEKRVAPISSQYFRAVLAEFSHMRAHVCLGPARGEYEISGGTSVFRPTSTHPASCYGFATARFTLPVDLGGDLVITSRIASCASWRVVLYCLLKAVTENIFSQYLHPQHRALEKGAGGRGDSEPRPFGCNRMLSFLPEPHAHPLHECKIHSYNAALVASRAVPLLECKV